MGKTKANYNFKSSGFPMVSEKTTFESILGMFPVVFYDDFIGAAGGSVFDGTMKWNIVDVGATSTAAIVANSSGGQFLLHLAAPNEAEDEVLYQNDNKTFDVGEGLIFECRLKMAVVPGTAVTAVFGMCGDHNLDKDTVANQAWFRLQASAVLLTESDDATNDNNDIATGITLTTAAYHIFRIDFTTITDVRFYVDGVRVSSATTFDMSNLNAAAQQMQPYFSLDKATGTGLGDLNIDYVKIFSDRT